MYYFHPFIDLYHFIRTHLPTGVGGFVGFGGIAVGGTGGCVDITSMVFAKIAIAITIWTYVGNFAMNKNRLAEAISDRKKLRFIFKALRMSV